MGDGSPDAKGIVYRIRGKKKPVKRDLWKSDIRARCPECTGYSTTMCYSGFNTCETPNCDVDVFKAPAMPDAPRYAHGRLHELGEWALAVQVGPRLARGEEIEQVRSKIEPAVDKERDEVEDDAQPLSKGGERGESSQAGPSDKKVTPSRPEVNEDG